MEFRREVSPSFFSLDVEPSALPVQTLLLLVEPCHMSDESERTRIAVFIRWYFGRLDRIHTYIFCVIVVQVSEASIPAYLAKADP